MRRHRDCSKNNVIRHVFGLSLLPVLVTAAFCVANSSSLLKSGSSVTLFLRKQNGPVSSRH
jgi:hypothetical protein